MNKFTSTMRTDCPGHAYEQQRTGHMPKSVTVVLSEDTLVITLHGALSPAELALSESPGGAAKFQEFQRQLFLNSASQLRQEIKRITGVEVREATAEVEPGGSVVHAFTTGTVVQVFLLRRCPDGHLERKRHPGGEERRNRAATSITPLPAPRGRRPITTAKQPLVTSGVTMPRRPSMPRRLATIARMRTDTARASPAFGEIRMRLAVGVRWKTESLSMDSGAKKVN